MTADAAARERRSILAPLQIWFLVLCISGLFMLLEAAWLLFLLWLPWFIATRWGIRASAMIGTLCAIVMVAHFCGYKAAGSPCVVENRPFEPDAHIAVLGPGTTVTLSDGRSFSLAGLTEKMRAGGPGTLGAGWRVSGRDDSSSRLGGAPRDASWPVQTERLRLWRTTDGIPVRITEEGGGRALVMVGVRHLYWCGVTFLPTIFPAHLPRYGRMDLGLLLLERADVVVPDGTERDSAYRAQLDTEYRWILQRDAREERESAEAGKRAAQPVPP